MAEALHIFVKAESEGRVVALFEGAKLLEYYAEEGAEDALVSAVVLGRVERVLPGMQAAFVAIGQPKSGFLPMKEQQSYQQTGARPLKTGDEILVQVKQAARGDKGAFLTRDIALPGETVLYMPNNRHVGVSRRVEDEADRARLTALGRELAGADCGLIMRAAALSSRREAVAEELQGLRQLWSDLAQKARYRKAPAVLHQEESVLSALARDYAPRHELRVTAGDRVNRMPSPPSGLLWEQVSELELDAHLRSLRLKEQLAEALGRRVCLPNGGTLVIDEREALTTLDVNTGLYTGAKGENVALSQNLAACPEIARQIRLRNLSGILLIDFIDMRTDEERAQVQKALEEALADDRVKSALHGFTSLGLMELTRKRTRPSLQSALCQPCGACGGTGWKRSEKA
ncbi:MAG: ribonuclease E/G [Eubacteriales bacterium]|nr:ribonuclease E/G [Eubacteriales bacterium]